MNFGEIFPGATPEAIDFLDKTLQFNPKRRITVDEAIDHPLLVKLRDKKREFIAPGILYNFEY